MTNETSRAAVDPRARAIIEKCLVWDNVWPVDLPGNDSVGNDWNSLARFSRAGVNAVGLTLAGDNHSSGEALRLVGWARAELRARSEQLMLVRNLADISASKDSGRLGIVLQFEGTRCFDRDLNLIELFYELGVRQTILAFNNSNSAGGGCAEKQDGGLTAYGRRLVREAERVGMLVDLSHVGWRTSLDALEIAQQPMVFSHSNSNAVHACFRNIEDVQARACALTGGLVGVSGSSEYLGDQRCRSETLFRHLDHFVQLVGADHVCIGLDVVFKPEPLSQWARRRPDEWPMAQDPAWPGFSYAVPEQLVELVALMVSNGYPDESIVGILGGNYVRVCGQVWN